MSDNALLRAALAFYADGYSPWPVLPGDKMPLRAGADRRTWGGRRHVPLTESEIRETWGGQTPPDLGVVILEGHFVLDLDPKNRPSVTEMFPELLRTTRCAWTPSKGLHAYFRCSGRAKSRHLEGVDIQGYGTFIVVPPSRGRTWANELPEAYR